MRVFAARCCGEYDLLGLAQARLFPFRVSSSERVLQRCFRLAAARLPTTIEWLDIKLYVPAALIEGSPMFE